MRLFHFLHRGRSTQGALVGSVMPLLFLQASSSSPATLLSTQSPHPHGASEGSTGPCCTPAPTATASWESVAHAGQDGRAHWHSPQTQPAGCRDRASQKAPEHSARPGGPCPTIPQARQPQLGQTPSFGLAVSHSWLNTVFLIFSIPCIYIAAGVTAEVWLTTRNSKISSTTERNISYPVLFIYQ